MRFAFSLFFFCFLMNHQCFIFLFIMAEFGLYVIIRQLVNTKEWISACMTIASLRFISGLIFCSGRGQKGRLRKRLRSARTYEVSIDTSSLAFYRIIPSLSRNGKKLRSLWTNILVSRNGSGQTRTHFMIGCLYAKYARPISSGHF